MKKIDFVVVGNLSFDYNFFPDRDKKEVMNLGGATLYSGIPASLFVKVGIAANVGEDYDLSIFDNLNFDITGIKQVEGKTTVFTQEFQSEDGQQRIFKEYVNPNTYLKPQDIPKQYLDAKYIHICTNYPDVQLELVKYLKENSNAILSIDTLEDYYYNSEQFEKIRESFDLVDIAFIDKEFNKLFNWIFKIELEVKDIFYTKYYTNKKMQYKKPATTTTVFFCCKFRIYIANRDYPLSLYCPSIMKHAPAFYIRTNTEA